MHYCCTASSKSCFWGGLNGVLCLKMNGAELPSGEQLLVEASHSNAFKESKKEEEGSDTRSKPEAAVLKDGPVAPQGEEDADDELDDFFSSV